MSLVIRLSIVILIGVFPLLISAQSSAPTASTPGTPSGSYQVSDLENINLYSGNLNVHVPIYSLGGRGDASDSISIAIERQWTVSQVHEAWQNPNDTVTQYSDSVPLFRFVGEVSLWVPSAQQGDVCGSGPEYYYTNTWDFKYTESDGTEHQLRSDLSYLNYMTQCGAGTSTSIGNVFRSTDGSFIKFITDAPIVIGGYGQQTDYSGYLFYKNGAKARIHNGRMEWKVDRNGNKITYPTTLLSSFTDILGRNLSATSLNESGYGNVTKFKYPGYEGTDRFVRIGWDASFRNTRSGDSTTAKTYGQLFAYGATGLGTIHDADNYFAPVGLPGHIWLPDGRYYEFQYNVYGQLARMVLPTGSAFEYDYYDPNSSGFGNPAVNRVKEKREYDVNGALTGKTTFGSSLILVDGHGGTKVAVKNYDSNGVLLTVSNHYFYGVPGATSGVAARWREGREFKTEFLKTDGTTVLRTIENTWQQYTPGITISCSPDPASDCAPENNPFVIETKTTLSDANLVSKTTSINPSTGAWGVDANGNVLDVWEYDYGSGALGTFLGRTHTDYVTDSSYTSCASFTAGCMVSLPSQTYISSDVGGSSKKALTTYEYDNYTADSNHAGLVSRSGAIGYDWTNFGTGYIKRGNLTGVTSYADAAGQTGSLSTYTQYDVLGNAVVSKDANASITTVSYEDKFGSADNEAISNNPPAIGGQYTFAFPTSTVNPLGWTTRVQYDYSTGNAVNSQDVNGMISKTSYNDPLDRPKQTVTAVGTSKESQLTITYADTSHFVQKTSDLNTLNDNLLKSITFFDGMGRPTESRSFEASGNYREVATLYDALGRAYATSNPFRYGETAIWTTSSFDSLGRVIQVRTPDGAVVQTAYDGNRTLVIDQASKKRLSKMNAAGQMTEVWEITPPDTWTEAVSFPGQSFSTGYKTTYVYDILNNLTTVNQGSQTRTFSYNSLSRLTTASNPESGTITYAYDSNGNLTNKTDARGVQTAYVYDELNRIKNRNYSAPGGLQNYLATPNVAYTYDASTIANSKGKLTKVTNGAGADTSTTDYTAFDIVGRVTAAKQTTDGGDTAGYATGYTYNLAGALVEETYPSGRVVKNAVDAAGDLAIVESKKNGASGYFAYASGFKYTAAGAVSDIKLGNGRWESTVFNTRLQPEQIALGSIQGATDKLKLNYSYGSTDNNGNVQSQTIAVPTFGINSGFSAVQSYNYDYLNRLKDSTENVTPIGGSNSQSWKQTFTFDRYGNRSFDESGTSANYATTTLTRGCSTSTYNPNGICNKKNVNPNIASSNKINLNQDGTGDYAVDSSGNTAKSADGNVYTYNGENKQTEVKNSASVSLGRYWYDGDGKRVKKYVAGTGETTIFVYDAAGKQIAEYAIVVADTDHAVVSYLTADDLGTPRINTDARGDVISRHDYLPFGEEIVGTGVRTTGLQYSEDGVRKHFTGYELDDETQLDFAQNRYYSNDLGRFSSVDPLMASAKTWNPQSWNRYSYVHNNPTSITDSLGLDDDCDPKKPCAVPSPNITNPGINDPSVTVTVGTFHSVPDGQDRYWYETTLNFLKNDWNKTETTAANAVSWLNRAASNLGFDRGTIELPSDVGADPAAGLDPNIPDSGGGHSGGTIASNIAQAMTLAVIRHYVDQFMNGRQMHDENIYRTGSAAPSNLAPRMRDLNGLSAQTNEPSNKPYITLDVAKLRASGLVVVNDGGRHVSIFPPSAGELRQWQIDKFLGAGLNNRYTRAVHHSIVK